MGAENIPGAVDRTGGIWLFDRKLRSWDSFAGDILATRETCGRELVVTFTDRIFLYF